MPDAVSPSSRARRSSPIRLLCHLLLLYPAWLGMMALHEAGHVLHAKISDGRVEHVSLPLLGFSETFYEQNPHPLFVALGGALWGTVLPLVCMLFVPKKSLRRYFRFFAGFCLIANGAYIGIGWLESAGDAADLLQYGVPRPLLVAFGAASCSFGLWLWHRLGVATP